jgi:site-specific recombinase XerD
MLGHKNITTTEVYAKMNDEQKMQTVSRITLKHD